MTELQELPWVDGLTIGQVLAASSRKFPAREAVVFPQSQVRLSYTELAAKDPKTAGADWVWAKETVLLEALIEKEPSLEVEVQAIQVGPVICIANPAEYFCQYGLELKAGSGFPMTFPVELANGCAGYVPTFEAFDEKSGGGYETRLTSYSNLDITAGRQFRDVGLELAHQMTPDKVQVPAMAPFKAPWSYGNVAPQRGETRPE